MPDERGNDKQGPRATPIETDQETTKHAAEGAPSAAKGATADAPNVPLPVVCWGRIYGLGWLEKGLLRVSEIRLNPAITWGLLEHNQALSPHSTNHRYSGMRWY